MWTRARESHKKVLLQWSGTDSAVKEAGIRVASEQSDRLPTALVQRAGEGMETVQRQAR